MSTVNKENNNLHFLYFWRNTKNNLNGQDHQQGLNLLGSTYGQHKSSFGIGRVVVRMRALSPRNVQYSKNGQIQWSYLLTMQHFPKGLMWARSSMGYGLSAKQVACPRYGWYGSSSGQNKGSLLVRTPFWTPLYNRRHTEVQQDYLWYLFHISNGYSME